jgi:hypothetical protein
VGAADIKYTTTSTIYALYEPRRCLPWSEFYAHSAFYDEASEKLSRLGRSRRINCDDDGGNYGFSRPLNDS